MTDKEGRELILRRVYDIKDNGESITLRAFDDLQLEEAARDRYIEQLDELGLIRAKILRSHRVSGNKIAQAIITITAAGSQYIEDHREVSREIVVPELANRKAYCIRCCTETNHQIVHAAELQSWEEIGEEHDVGGGGTYSILKCGGCENVTFLAETWFSENYDPEGESYEIEVTQYPSPPKKQHRKPDWLNGLPGPIPNEIEEFLDEIYSALENDNLRLSALGIRALVEHIMVGRIGDCGTLGKNIDAFLNAGYVAARDHDHFRHTLIAVGDAAMHRGYKPKDEDVRALLDITEALIASIFVHPDKAADIRARIPPRVKNDRPHR